MMSADNHESCRAEIASAVDNLRVAAQQGYRQAEEHYKPIVAALRMGLQLGESGKHGDGERCPTCHFVREARKALAGINKRTAHGND